MTTQYKEILASRSVSREGEESYTAVRQFLVYDDAGANLSANAAINWHEGVRFGDSHPDAIACKALSFSISAVSDRKYTWQITWNYRLPDEDEEDNDNSNNTDIDPISGGEFEPPNFLGQASDSEDGDDGIDQGEPEEDETEVPFTGISLTTGVAMVDGFRAGATIPTNGSETGSAISTGTAIHTGGKPVTVIVPITEISLTKTLNSSYFYLNDVQLNAGKRNVNTFYGFAAGTVVFVGMSVQRQEIDRWEVTYNFTWDAWSHMRQVPKRLLDGTLDWNTDETLDIFFKQPFPDLISFDFAP
jgi:hypothetical protein